MDMIAACVSKSPPLNESPSEKEGKCSEIASKGFNLSLSLNESPSEKEGKSLHPALHLRFSKTPQ